MSFQLLAHILPQAASQGCSLSEASYLYLQDLGKAPKPAPGQRGRYSVDETLRCLFTLRLSASRIRELAGEEHEHPVSHAQFRRFREWGLLPEPDADGLYPLSTLAALLAALGCPIYDMARRTLCLRLAWQRFPVPGAIICRAMLALTASADSFRGHGDKAKQLERLLAPEPSYEGQPSYLTLMLAEQQALLAGWRFPPFPEWYGALSGEGGYHTDDGNGAHVGGSLAELVCLKCEQRWQDHFDSRVGFWYTTILNLRHAGRLIDSRFDERRDDAIDIPIEEAATILAVRELSQLLYQHRRARELEQAGRLSPLGHVIPEPTASEQGEPVRAVPF